MEYLAILAASLGTVVPFLVAILKQTGLSKNWNRVISVVICAGVGVLVTWQQGQLDVHNLTVTLPIVFAASQIAYKTYLEDWLGNFSEWTSFIK